MQLMTSLLGESAGAIVTSALALGIVVVLIVLGLWVLKLFTRSTVAVGRGRNRRLSVIDHMQVDAKRQLLIVRRDNVEHLILTGGPQDLVVETGIPVERPPLPAHRPAQHEVPPPPTPTLTQGEIDKLRQFVRPGAANRKPTSLRHTGLLRPVSTMEPAIIPMTPMTGITPAGPEQTQLQRPKARITGGRRLGLNAISETRARPDRATLRRVLTLLGLIAAILLPTLAFSQDVSIDFGDDTTITERAVQIVGLITLLSLAPSILVMVTSFTRIVVVLSLLRTAIGLQTAPPNSVMVSLALFLTLFVMGPTLQQSYDNGIAPLIAGTIPIEEAFTRTAGPVHAFMLANVREQDLQLFFDMSQTQPPTDPAATPLQTLIPAFMISELRRAFEIGFLLFLPFVIIDMVVASVLMSMGMMMLPPVVISLPFKLIFFVLVDGWHLVAGSLVRSFTGS